ncbi:AraC family transcriptional regulator [Tenacibaculum amylolyticum]
MLVLFNSYTFVSMEKNEKNTAVFIRINKAIQYIESELATDLSLEDVANEAYFSPFHFHRVFKAITKETLHNYITRKRIEKAASLLIHQSEKTVTEITELVGFNSIAAFSRAFKKFYGLSPKEFREKTPSKFSKICKTESKNGEISTQLQQYICNIQNHLNFIRMKAKSIGVNHIEAIKVAYIPHIGLDKSLGNTFEKLLKWAYPKGLMNGNNKVLTIYHDSPKITAQDKLRMSACVSLENAEVDTSDINTRIIPAGKYITAHFEISIEEFQQAWEGVFVWIFDKGFKVRSDIDPFEVYLNNFNEHPEKICFVDLYVPIQ